MIPADGGGVSTAAAADLKVGAGVLQTFKQRVDKILRDFEGSDGSSSKVGHHTFTQDAVTSAVSFYEAVSLHKEYETIHGRITELSKMLALQIEAMGIASHGAEVGFDNLEEDQRRRFWAIQTKIDLEAEASADRREQSGQPARPRGDDKHVDVKGNL
ncbi:hypothetical protein OKJ48_18405 [Streptomyces kunmingensis]|uniref:Uncharacterized protein n=1 Tax=Streptomyces kunmingensis TaxID=68225 RepID=A0ABU6CBY2_9ACTN|nr:hypothetical protein [Streptomyces kunmingensis]MEB3962208.1 hypothetical protein [Streptomyces kunmingensis]